MPIKPPRWGCQNIQTAVSGRQSKRIQVHSFGQGLVGQTDGWKQEASARQAFRQIDRYTDRQTDRQMDRQTDGWPFERVVCWPRDWLNRLSWRGGISIHLINEYLCLIYAPAQACTPSRGPIPNPLFMIHHRAGSA